MNNMIEKLFLYVSSKCPYEIIYTLHHLYAESINDNDYIHILRDTNERQDEKIYKYIMDNSLMNECNVPIQFITKRKAKYDDLLDTLYETILNTIKNTSMVIKIIDIFDVEYGNSFINYNKLLTGFNHLCHKQSDFVIDVSKNIIDRGYGYHITICGQFLINGTYSRGKAKYDVNLLIKIYQIKLLEKKIVLTLL